MFLNPIYISEMGINLCNTCLGMGVTFFLGSATFSSALDVAGASFGVMASLDKSKATVRKAEKWTKNHGCKIRDAHFPVFQIPVGKREIW